MLKLQKSTILLLVAAAGVILPNFMSVEMALLVIVVVTALSGLILTFSDMRGIMNKKR